MLPRPNSFLRLRVLSLHPLRTRNLPFQLARRSITQDKENSSSRTVNPVKEGESDEPIDGNPNAVLQPPFQPPGSSGSFTITRSPTFDAAVTTVIGIAMVFVGGIVYFSWYKKNVLDKIEQAFQPGYDPALELATHINPSKKPNAQEAAEDDWTTHLRRKEQDEVDRIVSGDEPGKYFVLAGPKGTGKGTMIFDAMHAIRADGVAFCEAHPDLEVFRLRLGKALNFEYNEDTQTGLFQRRDPREGGPALDIERALNKLEKVSLRLSRRKKRPLVLIFNNVHLLNNEESGKNILLQLQQRAETWAESGILTMVFVTDDFWPLLTLRKTANRMQIISITDLSGRSSMSALRHMRHNAFPSESPDHYSSDGVNTNERKVLHEIIKITGGRLAYLAKVARSRDMIKMANHLLDNEKSWLLDHIGLIPDHDDDVMDEQKWSSCSWLLLQEFVKLRLEQERERDEKFANGTYSDDPYEELPLPAIPYWKCRQIMTRPDFLEGLDEKNIISIDMHSNVRPDSALTLEAARDVVCQPDFEAVLQNVRDRVDEIESLHRTRELTLKDFPALSLRDLSEEDSEKIEKLKKDWLKGKWPWR